MTKQLFTVFDTDFDLSDLDDCHAFVDALEAFGKIHTWKLYDLLCEVDQIQGDEEDYHQFLNIIAEKFGQTIDTERELCTDDAAAKTILTTFSSAIDQNFRSNGTQPFVIGFDATPFVGEEVEHFTLEGFGTANEENHVPVQQVMVETVKLRPYKETDLPESVLVTKVIEPVLQPDGLVKVGQVGMFAVYEHFDEGSFYYYVTPSGDEHPTPLALIPRPILDVINDLLMDFEDNNPYYWTLHAQYQNQKRTV